MLWLHRRSLFFDVTIGPKIGGSDHPWHTSEAVQTTPPYGHPSSLGSAACYQRDART